MTDPRAPVDIASFPTELRANMFAAMLRDEGIQAAVFGRGASFTGLVQDCPDWRLLVPAEDVQRARQIIIEAREAHDESVEVEVCPGCGYSMAGLAGAERCPECGRELSEDRENLKVQGLIHSHDATSAATPTPWPWKALWVVLLVVILAGLAVIIIQTVAPWVMPRLDWAWWTPAPLGLIAFMVGIGAMIRRRRKARRSGADSETGLDPTETVGPPGTTP